MLYSLHKTCCVHSYCHPTWRFLMIFENLVRGLCAPAPYHQYPNSLEIELEVWNLVCMILVHPLNQIWYCIPAPFSPPIHHFPHLPISKFFKIWVRSLKFDVNDICTHLKTEMISHTTPPILFFHPSISRFFENWVRSRKFSVRNFEVIKF